MTDKSSFYPFEDAQSRSDHDFNVKDIASYLDLDKLQTRFLLQWLRRLDLTLWFAEDDDETNPRLVVAVFTDDGFVADVNLTRLISGLDEQFNQIGDAPEIQALEELKAAIEAAIKARKERQRKELKEQAANASSPNSRTRLGKTGKNAKKTRV